MVIGRGQRIHLEKTCLQEYSPSKLSVQVLSMHSVEQAITPYLSHMTGFFHRPDPRWGLLFQHSLLGTLWEGATKKMTTFDKIPYENVFLRT